MAKVRIYQKPAGIPANTSVFAVEILQNNIWYTRKVSWETLKGLIAGAESLVFDNGTLTFTTPDGVAHQVLSVDSEVTPNSVNPVSGGAVNTALAGKQDTLTFDAVPTDGSTNPVESNGIFDALAGKQDTLTFDTTPTDGSTNPVTSAGIYAAISAITTGIDWKEAVATYADIATTYPNPQDGWTVTTLDDDHTYRYTGTEWVDMFSLITLATSSKDGLMSATDFTKLAGIEAEANKTVVTNTLTPSTTTKRIATVSGGGSSTDILGDDADAILRAAFGEHTATGNPVSVDAFLGLEVVSECKVTMNPIQDLHGYESPWPAGGGKNKIGSTLTYIKSANTSGTWSGNDYTLNGLSFAVLVDSDNNVTGIKVTGTASERTDFRVGVPDLVTGTDYIVNGCPENGSDSTYRLSCLYGANSSAHDRGNGSATFTATGYEGAYCYIRIASEYSIATGGLTYYPMVRLSTEQDTTFAPYSNICPISGRDSVDVVVTGKNLLNVMIEQGGFYSAGSKSNRTDRCRTVTAMQIKPNTEYTASVGGDAILVGIYFYTSETIHGSTFFSRLTGSGKTLTFTTPSEAGYVAFQFAKSDMTSDIIPSEVINPMLELGSTATDYEPYQGQTHTATFPSTVYGGVDDFVSGEGSETYGIADLGSVNWTRQDAGGRWYFFTYVSNLTNCKTYSSPRTQPLLCSQYKNFHNGEAYADLPEGAIYNASINNTPIIAIIDTRYTDATAFKTAMSGVQLCYELATPTQITNTPEDISLLKGVNVVSTDADSLELKYSADIKAYIDSKLNA